MIIGNKINLVALNEETLEKTFIWQNDPTLREYTGARFPVSKIEHEKWFKEKILDKVNLTFAIREHETKKIVGIIGNNNSDLISRHCNIFIYLGDPATRGKGLGKEAVTLFTTLLFEEANFNKVYAYVYAYNISSIKLFESCGYEKEAILKKHWYKNGVFNDVYVFSKFK